MYAPFPSPLRYPGGKTFLKGFLAETIRLNQITGGAYVEPYAGGAGAALSLLFTECVSDIHINDKDPCIYSFWKAILNDTERFLERLDRTPISVKTWKEQKSIMRSPKSNSELDLGFATFFLNRCNRSGVLNGGPIGGLRQDGEYNMRVRFNKEGLRDRIHKIGLYRDRISAWNLDGVQFLKSMFTQGRIDATKSLVYMDPPYFKKAERLYSHYFEDSDHLQLSEYLNLQTDFRWVVSYDDTSMIRRLYSGAKKAFRRGYSVHSVKVGRELIMASRNCVLPRFLSGVTYSPGPSSHRAAGRIA
jgi:DNA adenine methylase